MTETSDSVESFKVEVPQRPKGLVMKGTLQDLIDGGFLPNKMSLVKEIQDNLGRARALGGKDCERRFSAPASTYRPGRIHFYSSLIYNDFGAMAPEAQEAIQNAFFKVFQEHGDWDAFELEMKRGASIIEMFHVFRAPGSQFDLNVARNRMYYRMNKESKRIDP